MDCSLLPSQRMPCPQTANKFAKVFLLKSFSLYGTQSKFKEVNNIFAGYALSIAHSAKSDSTVCIRTCMCMLSSLKPRPLVTIHWAKANSRDAIASLIINVPITYVA